MNKILAFFASLIAQPDMTAPVAVHAAYVIHTSSTDEAPAKCCGRCNGTGQITHGDWHKTPCPCPDDCECKAVRHPSVLITCPDGKCAPKK